MCDEIVELLNGTQPLTFHRHHGVKFLLFHELCHHVNAANELAIDEDLRKSRPLRIELSPLSDSVVFQNVEGTELIALKHAQ